MMSCSILTFPEIAELQMVLIWIALIGETMILSLSMSHTISVTVPVPTPTRRKIDMSS